MDPAGETPNDILVEARKNLQFWIDSGLSREALMDLIVTSDAPAPQQHSQQLQHQQSPQQTHTLPSDSRQYIQQSQQHVMQIQQQQQHQHQHQPPSHIKTEAFPHDVSQDIILEDVSATPGIYTLSPSFLLQQYQNEGS
jgi:hypothetical protein